jgi:hypothetical protein
LLSGNRGVVRGILTIVNLPHPSDSRLAVFTMIRVNLIIPYGGWNERADENHLAMRLPARVISARESKLGHATSFPR